MFIALLVLDAWVEMHSPDASASGNDIFGFFPLFVLGFGGPLNLIGVIVASSRAKEQPAKWKLNKLGMILNLSPYVIFFVIMFFGLAVAPFFS
ncbi:cell division protein FtsW [Actinomyces sp. HPA0247]|uniref:cell division protein FtsW n=1 Tax=Actinomyces sp. HPA0247 TaxID=1203556 RepID=UPI0003A2BCDD|nr:cell division protein FtsW [Actinomyces sp. HPA0247]